MIDAHSIVLFQGKTCILSNDGEVIVQDMTAPLPASLSRDVPVLCLHGPYTRQKVGIEGFALLDVLELYAFIRPGQFCIPGITGLCDALGLSVPETGDDAPIALQDSVAELLHECKNRGDKDKARIADLSAAMTPHWGWAGLILESLGLKQPGAMDMSGLRRIFMQDVKDLPEWAEEAPAPPPDFHPITAEESLHQLDDALNRTQGAEARPQQKTYAVAAISAFDPPTDDDHPHIVMAEAGTGTGKTLGYLAPGVAWAEKNQSPVWVSTYTRNLQRQLEEETHHLYPDPATRKRKVVSRKGRDNYLCLQKYEDLVTAAITQNNPKLRIAAGILARWIGAGHEGDFTGAHYPGWLSGILGYTNSLGLADTGRECTYSACEHYKSCFIEGSRRRAGHARLVIANHALVMTQAATSMDKKTLPARMVFDEGHHLFDAADSAFAAHFTVRRGLELRRWILGPEGARPGKSRGRGLAKRLEGLIKDTDEEAQAALQALLVAARALPDRGSFKRIQDGQTKGPIEGFLFHLSKQVENRSDPGILRDFGAETPVQPLEEGVVQATSPCIKALSTLRKPMAALVRFLSREMEESEREEFDPASHRRMEALASGLSLRADGVLGAWISMLEEMAEDDQDNSPFINWFESAPSLNDIGFYRAMLDPMQAFADVMQPQTHGMIVTSATLTDRASEDTEEEWMRAESRAGIGHFQAIPRRLSLPSPFDYARQARIIIIQGMARASATESARAMRDLFLSANGGALGLFTAIHRLRTAAPIIESGMSDHGIHLLAQHVDDMDTGTLVDIFKADANSCLLGTDAVRDGVDVPGEALRLMVFDRVPWPRPTILHKRRRSAAPSARIYDDAHTRMRLKQAFGRLIRSNEDRGVFVMLDSSLPSRLYDAFPAECDIQKSSLQEAKEVMKEFLS